MKKLYRLASFSSEDGEVFDAVFEDRDGGRVVVSMTEEDLLHGMDMCALVIRLHKRDETIIFGRKKKDSNDDKSAA